MTTSPPAASVRWRPRSRWPPKSSNLQISGRGPDSDGERGGRSSHLSVSCGRGCHYRRRDVERGTKGRTTNAVRRTDIAAAGPPRPWRLCPRASSPPPAGRSCPARERLLAAWASLWPPDGGRGKEGVRDGAATALAEIRARRRWALSPSRGPRPDAPRLTWPEDVPAPLASLCANVADGGAVLRPGSAGSMQRPATAAAVAHVAAFTLARVALPTAAVVVGGGDCWRRPQRSLVEAT